MEDSPLGIAEARKQRGAYFTHPNIASFLSNWAIRDPDSKVLDPSCGEAVFLHASGQRLIDLGAPASKLRDLIYGVDIHAASLNAARTGLQREGFDAQLVHADFFEVPRPDQLGCPLPLMDAVVGNPPFVRYQLHTGKTRRVAAEAAMREGVRLSGLASSWAPLLVHASSFLKADGRLAMVLPAELLTVHYAEPIRRWLKNRFESVSLVIFERLQFADAMENVVLLLARGSGGCDAFSLYFAQDRDELLEVGLENWAVTPSMAGKWTDLLLPVAHRQLFKKVTADAFTSLEWYGTVGLGSVTGNNAFFTLSEQTKREFALREDHLFPISPPGTRHLGGMSFSTSDWNSLRDAGERVWLFRPDTGNRSSAVTRYIEHGERLGVHDAYKCQVRDPWWRPPLVQPPDMFFTYMSHRFPRLIANAAKASFVNSMHGLWLSPGPDRWIRQALPLVALNSVTLLGAEVFGRSYGGGVLKMEPREAAHLPVPNVEHLSETWQRLRPEKARLDRELRQGRWTTVLARVDEVLLRDVLGLKSADAERLHEAARLLRQRRLNRRLLVDDA